MMMIKTYTLYIDGYKHSDNVINVAIEHGGVLRVILGDSSMEGYRNWGKFHLVENPEEP